MSKSMQIVEILSDYNFNLTKDDMINLKLVMKIIDSKKKINTLNFIYNDDSLYKKILEKIDTKLKVINLMINNCSEVETDKLTILFVYQNELINLKEDFLNEFNNLYNSLDKIKEEKKLIDNCIKSIYNGKSNNFKKTNISKDILSGEKYEIEINLLDTILESLEDKKFINEIKINLPLIKELYELKEKLYLYQLIIDNKDIINLYKEKKICILSLNNNIKNIKQKLELVKQNEKSLSGKIINFFSSKENKISTLEENLEENQKVLEDINKDLNKILENITDYKLKNILTNISFYDNEIDIDEFSIISIKEKITKLSNINCSEKSKKMINENPDFCETLLILSSKKQKFNTTPIISFHILKVLSDFYQLDLIIDKDSDIEKLINEINTKYEKKLQKFSNIGELIIQKTKVKKHYIKHSTLS